jgi:secretion/DNA translocation related TadE-like protein
VIGCVVVLATLAAGWLAVTRSAFARQRAEAAADLAALAAASSRQHGQPGCAAAGETAARNGATVLTCSVADEEVTITVRVGGAIAATAQARAGPREAEMHDR